jgi:hypothetical protein
MKATLTVFGSTLVVAAVFGFGCGSGSKSAMAPAPSAVPSPENPRMVSPLRSYNQIARMDFNRFAVRANLPVYWIVDGNNDKAIAPSEVASLLFYPSAPVWVKDGKFTAEFDSAYDLIVKLAAAPDAGVPSADLTRHNLVSKDLDAGRATLVLSDLSALSAQEKVFTNHMLTVAALIDELYDQQTGVAALVGKVTDVASQSLLRRNRGPACIAPGSESDPACSAIAGMGKAPVGVYPSDVQADPAFCKTLEARKDAKELLTPFSAVMGQGSALKAVPYPQAYPSQMQAVAKQLREAADAINTPAEIALVTYLRAAATAFEDNNWQPADEAWAKMSVDNSKWYVRAAPDEVYWEPCSQKAGFHLTFARINQGSIAWQQKLVPVQQEMEAAIAARAGAPYKAHKVTFHLPDFIDLVVNAGDDRDGLGATIGQSLPNWGPVANEGRGRTVAMTNLYKDADSNVARRAQAESMLSAASMKHYVADSQGGLLATILHEATHNLGPAHEYTVKGKTDDAIFGGPIASMMEEFKAQTGGLFLVEFLRAKGLISDELAAETYADSIVWAFGHISQGMYAGSGATKTRKTYSQLAAIQIGLLIDAGALVWDAKMLAANGTDIGAFTIVDSKLLPAIDDMMKISAGIKARGDVAAAKALIAKYVDGKAVPHTTISERFLRVPKASFVYAIVGS